MSAFQTGPACEMRRTCADSGFCAGHCTAPSQSPQPVAWALYNPATGKVDHRCYQREDAARAGASNQSNRWRTFVAVPLFLHPDHEGQAMMEINGGVG